MVAVAGGSGTVGKSLTQGLVGEGGQLRSECLDEARVATLRDGSTVLLRRLDAADIDAVIALHDALSDQDALNGLAPGLRRRKACGTG